jgi:hypothetical protein
MSKKKNTTTGLIIAAGVAALLYFLLNRNQPRINPPQFQNIPPRPSTKGEAFNQWVMSIIALYGQSKSLFEPGGPFYKIPTKDIYDIVGSSGMEDYA